MNLNTFILSNLIILKYQLDFDIFGIEIFDFHIFNFDIFDFEFDIFDFDIYLL